MRSRAETEAADVPNWLGVPACIVLAIAVALAGMVGMGLVPLVGSNERTRAYHQWLEKYQAVQRLCGEWTPKSAECWSRHPLPAQPGRE